MAPAEGVTIRGPSFPPFPPIPAHPRMPHASDSLSSLRSGTLSPADADAIDALVSAGFTPERVPTELQARAARAMAVLNLLQPASVALDAGALVDSTLERLRSASPLSGADAAALDSLVDSGWATARDDRAARILTLVSALEPAAAPASGTRLTDNTLDRIQKEIDRSEALRRIAATIDLNPAKRRFTLSDVAAIAAVGMVAFGVLWPAAAAWREKSREQACAANLSNAAMGFGLFAGDHHGALPSVAAAGFGGGAEFVPAPQPSQPGTWWNVGDPQHSHSANLYVLIRAGYANPSDLACAGNAAASRSQSVLDARRMADWRSPEEISFSYQLPPRRARALWNGPTRLVVLADKSPIIDRARRGEGFDPNARSLNHRGSGQNILWSDGSVEFAASPVLPSGDNIWLPASVTGRGAKPTLKGVERPDSDTDAFVAP